MCACKKDAHYYDGVGQLESENGSATELEMTVISTSNQDLF